METKKTVKQISDEFVGWSKQFVPDPTSNCCDMPIKENTDVCSSCQEHCAPVSQCEACNQDFSSKIGEVMCSECVKELVEAQDRSEINRIIARRGVEWVVERLKDEEVRRQIEYFNRKSHVR